jgi:hypothetical protein
VERCVLPSVDEGKRYEDTTLEEEGRGNKLGRRLPMCLCICVCIDVERGLGIKVYVVCDRTKKLCPLSEDGNEEEGIGERKNQNQSINPYDLSHSIKI